MNKFNVGDRVKCWHINYYGKVGVIFACTSDNKGYRIQFEGTTKDPNLPFHEEWLEKVEEAKFKVGDKVCVLNTSFIGYISFVYDKCYIVNIIDSNIAFSYTEDMLEKVDEEKKPKFKIGDRVRVKTKELNQSYVGTIAKIESSGQKRIEYFIQLDGTYSNGFVYYEDEIELEEKKPKFKVGDSLAVMYNEDVTFSILEINHDTQRYKLKIDEHIKWADKKEIDGLCRKIHNSKFKVGDVVRDRLTQKNVTIKTISTTKYHYVILDDLYEQMFSESIERFESLVEKVNTPKFKVGDLVCVLANNSVGKITEIQHTYENQYKVEFGPTLTWFYKERDLKFFERGLLML